MCRHDFKYLRIFRLWRIVVGYSAFLVVFAWLLVPAVSLNWRDWVSALMPVTFDSYWFFTKYLALFLTIPFLNKMIFALSGRERIIMLISGCCLLSLSPVLTGRDLFGVKWGYSYVWFVFLYLVGACLALHQIANKIGMSVKWLGLLACCVFSALADPLSRMITQWTGGGGRLGELAWSYTSPLMFLEAVSLILIFACVKIRKTSVQKLIQLIAPGTFVVYIVHMNRVFRQSVGWDHCFLTFAHHGEMVAILTTAAAAVAIFSAVVCVDAFRRFLFGALARLGRRSVGFVCVLPRESHERN